MRASCTEKVAILGSDGYAECRAGLEGLGARYGLSSDQTLRLLERYGALLHEVLEPARVDLGLLEPVSEPSGYLWAEIAYAVTHEGARHLEDVLALRTRIAIETRDRGTAVAPAVAAAMARHLNWDDADIAHELESHRRLVAAELAAEGERDDAAAAAAMASADLELRRR